MNPAIVSIVIIILLMEAAWKGWREGAVEVSSPILSLVISLILVKMYGNNLLTRVFDTGLNYLNKFVSHFNDVEIEEPNHRLYVDLFGESGAEKFGQVLTFLIAFFVLYILIALIIKTFNTRMIPGVGKIDSTLGLFLGVCSRMCVIWVIMAGIALLASYSASVTELVDKFDTGIFHAMYHNNPILRFIVGKIEA